MLRNLRGLGSLITQSSNYWKESLEKTICTCSRPDLEEPNDQSQTAEVKKDLFLVYEPKHSPQQIVEYQKEWTIKEDQVLIDSYYNKKIRNWKMLSEVLQTKSPQQCCYRIKKLKEKAKTKLFTRHIDLKLIQMVNTHGKHWEKIALSFPGFTAPMLEDRYRSKLDPNLKRSKFTADEDDKIIALFEVHGNNWKKIAGCFVDRSSNMIKNRFYSVLKKRLPYSTKSKTRSELDSSSNMYLIPSVDKNEFDQMTDEQLQFNFNNYHTDNDNDNEPECFNNNKDNGNEVTISDKSIEENIDSKMNNLMLCDNNSNNCSNNSSGRNNDEEANDNIPMEKFMEVCKKVFYTEEQEVELYPNHGSNSTKENK